MLVVQVTDYESVRLYILFIIIGLTRFIWWTDERSTSSVSKPQLITYFLPVLKLLWCNILCYLQNEINDSGKKRGEMREKWKYKDFWQQTSHVVKRHRDRNGDPQQLLSETWAEYPL
jgi:hypothetical protein